MQVAAEYIESVAETLNLSGEEMIRESIKFFLEKKIREIKTDIYKIRTKSQ